MSMGKEETLKQLLSELTECNRIHKEAKEKDDFELANKMFNLRFEIGYAIVSLMHYEED